GGGWAGPVTHRTAIEVVVVAVVRVDPTCGRQRRGGGNRRRDALRRRRIIRRTGQAVEPLRRVDWPAQVRGATLTGHRTGALHTELRSEIAGATGPAVVVYDTRLAGVDATIADAATESARARPHRGKGAA